MRRISVIFISAVVSLVAPMVLAFSPREEPKVLQWAELIPPEARVIPRAPRSPFDLGKLEQSNDITRGPPPPPEPNEGQWMSRPTASKASEPPKVVEALDGKLVRIGGYVVPLDFDATTVKEFLLVPFVGACVHVPPPPANQIIYVKTAEGFKLSGLFDPVYVTGVLRTKVTFTGLAQTGYSLEARRAELRSVQ